jgi:hypothetical protein
MAYANWIIRDIDTIAEHSFVGIQDLRLDQQLHVQERNHLYKKKEDNRLSHQYHIRIQLI